MAETQSLSFDRLEHYKMNIGPIHEFGDLSEAPANVRNIGWTLGNDCPYRCTHCYSMNARERGRDLTIEMIDRIVDQLQSIHIETVNLGGNEPLFTNGRSPKRTLLPYIISKLSKAGITVGLTTSGISVLWLYRDHRDAFRLLNDCDISFDSPIEQEHNRNRGAKIFSQAVEALEICEKEGLSRTCIMAAMNWNFSIAHIEGLVSLAKKYGANVRINPIKPTEPQHMGIALPTEMYYNGFARLLELCDAVDLGEPPIAAVTDLESAGRCPCGRTSFRIHSITPEGAVYVSPCVYLHDFKCGLDLLKHDLATIIYSPQFRVFRQRNAHPANVRGCSGCRFLRACGGGCVARSYLYNRHLTGEKTMLARDPYCPALATLSRTFPQRPALHREERLVHMDYLCTWIGRPI